MKKVISLLKDYKNIDFGCNMDELHKEIDEAIKEIEALDARKCNTCKRIDDVFNECNLFRLYYSNSNKSYEECTNTFSCGFWVKNARK